VPVSARVISEKGVPPRWDSCDGRADSFGWDPVRVLEVIELGDPGSSAGRVEQKLTATGWTYERTTNPPFLSRWRQVLRTGEMSQLDLMNGANASSFVLVLSAQSPGPVVRGC
ncbi:MAG: hypothetical protein ACRDRT_18710, partial [Pseudonocardiaceae bacterium]